MAPTDTPPLVDYQRGLQHQPGDHGSLENAEYVSSSISVLNDPKFRRAW